MTVLNKLCDEDQYHETIPASSRSHNSSALTEIRFGTGTASAFSSQSPPQVEVPVQGLFEDLKVCGDNAGGQGNESSSSRPNTTTVSEHYDNNAINGDNDITALADTLDEEDIALLSTLDTVVAGNGGGCVVAGRPRFSLASCSSVGSFSCSDASPSPPHDEDGVPKIGGLLADSRDASILAAAATAATSSSKDPVPLLNPDEIFAAGELVYVNGLDERENGNFNEKGTLTVDPVTLISGNSTPFEFEEAFDNYDSCAGERAGGIARGAEDEDQDQDDLTPLSPKVLGQPISLSELEVLAEGLALLSVQQDEDGTKEEEQGAVVDSGGSALAPLSGIYCRPCVGEHYDTGLGRCHKATGSANDTEALEQRIANMTLMDNIKSEQLSYQMPKTSDLSVAAAAEADKNTEKDVPRESQSDCNAGTRCSRKDNAVSNDSGVNPVTFLSEVSTRHQAMEVAAPFASSFGVALEASANAALSPSKRARKSTSERTCFGHKETIFGLAFSPCGNYLATASQDSMVKIWDAGRNKCLSTLTGHDREHECLRVAWAPPHWGSSILHKNRAAKNCDSDDSRGHFSAAGENEEDFILASAGADGIVKVWRPLFAPVGGDCSCLLTIDHCRKDGDGERIIDVDDQAVPQVYALQFLNRWGLEVGPFSDGVGEGRGFLLTSSDDHLHVWELEEKGSSPSPLNVNESSKRLRMRKILSYQFTHLDKGMFGVLIHFMSASSSSDSFSVCDKREAMPLSTIQEEENGNDDYDGIGKDEPSPNNVAESNKAAFGGDRNPENLVFVFDAMHCLANGLLAVALSDGTTRIVNGRGVCVAILSLPGCNVHLTSLAWDSSGRRIATCVATGHLVLWRIEVGESRTLGGSGIRPSCAAVLEGGHETGRPLFGAQYCGGITEDLVVSWGVDGKLCIWDSFSEGQIHSPLYTLVSKPEYPIYAVDVATARCDYDHAEEERSVGTKDVAVTRIAVGGGRDTGFLGVPVYIYDVCEHVSSASTKR